MPIRLATHCKPGRRATTLTFRSLALALAAAAALPAAASADVLFVVDDAEDRVDVLVGDGECAASTGHCTLRAAVMEANVSSGAGTVTIVVPAGTYTLTRPALPPLGDDDGDLDLMTPAVGNPTIAILGAGPTSTIIDANQLDRVFFVHAGRTATIAGITLRNGFTTASGGGLLNYGSLVLDRSTLSDNIATGPGGGLWNNGSLVLDRSKLSGNHAVQGGGIFNQGALEVRQSTLSDNTAVSGGGAILNAFANFVYLVNSTLSGNRTESHGGAIYNIQATVWTYNVTIVANQADADDDGTGVGGGVTNGSSLSYVFLRNTIVAGNYRAALPIADDCVGPVGVFGHTKFSTFDGCTISDQNPDASHSLIGSLAELGPLQANGGPTETHALLAPSDMIDGANDPPGCTYGGTLTVDQRAGTRGLGALCDIGAFEAGALPDGLIFADDFDAGDLLAW